MQISIHLLILIEGNQVPALTIKSTSRCHKPRTVGHETLAPGPGCHDHIIASFHAAIQLPPRFRHLEHHSGPMVHFKTRKLRNLGPIVGSAWNLY